MNRNIFRHPRRRKRMHTPVSVISCARKRIVLGTALVFALVASAVFAQTGGYGCKVLDPELQGTYAGGCMNGLADGSGEAAGTARYQGVFKAGKKHGKGIKTWPDTGDRYEGDFVEDRKQGTGTYAWGPRSAWAGENYRGAYVGDQRHGPGVYQWHAGDRYSGPWEYDNATGPATPMMLARARTYVEAKAAVARPGIKVCREMTVGIATREWIRGVVTGFDDNGVTVRIDDAGQMGHVIRGNPINKGTLVTDDFPHWMPC